MSIVYDFSDEQRNNEDASCTSVEKMKRDEISLIFLFKNILNNIQKSLKQKKN